MRSMIRTTLQRGFSLIEAMVGLAVGMIAVVIIAQTFQVFEISKSTTAAGADAQENGLMALTMIEQDVRNAGQGFADSGAFDCNLFYSYLDDGTNPAGPIPGLTTAPVTIVDGGATGSDTVIIRAGQDFLGTIPAYLRDTMPQPSAELDISRTYGFHENDLIIVSQGGNCTVMQVTRVQEAALKLQHNPNATPPVYNPTINYQANPDGDPNTADGWPAFTTGAKVYNMGNLASRTYSINTNNLRLVDSPGIGLASSTLTLVNQIVNLQARYGVAPANSEVVDSWVDATGSWASLDMTEIKRIKAVEVTIVARSPKREPEAVTSDAQLVSEIQDAGLRTIVKDGIKALFPSNEWQFYRYKTYRTIVPLKNVLWANV